MAIKNLQFLPFSSVLDNGFWHQLTKRKIELYQLDESLVDFHGYYSNVNAPGLPPLANVDYSAFDEIPQTVLNNFPFKGCLLNTNTLEKFKDLDKQDLLNKAGLEIWDNIVSGKAVDHPDLLSRILCLTFADLKKYTFIYWFAFPALTFPKETNILKQITLLEYLSSDQIQKLSTLYKEAPKGDKQFFIINITDGEVKLAPLKRLKELKTGKNLIGFSDPSSIENYPGWPLRNLLALVAHHWGQEQSKWEVLCYRERIKEGVRSCNNSIVITVEIEVDEKDKNSIPKCVGWEKNEKGKLGPRKVDLSSSMDPQKLSESAVDLNLKLMKWRLVPDLNLDKISATKCLLFGAGTLGCNVARGLIGWGIRNITFVDNGTVSYSNPVRQSLFTFEDCLNGGKPKAAAAAEALRKIVPNIKSKSVLLTIPMPGHSISASAIEQVRDDVQRIEELISEHDAIFLLTDTRESRWLPTVIAAAKRKIVINAALGFDTFLVLRHGLKTEASASGISNSCVQDLIPGDQLGCYYCNDVVAPGDSTKDRTLDQQCTVTRPGISLLASALAVELLVSALQHPEGALAPADARGKDELLCDSVSPLGIVPHQIRGFLSRFYHILPATSAFGRCTACSQYILSRYETEGFNFLLRVFNEPTYLEDVTGLKQLQNETDLSEIWELSDDE